MIIIIKLFFSKVKKFEDTTQTQLKIEINTKKNNSRMKSRKCSAVKLLKLILIANK